MKKYILIIAICLFASCKENERGLKTAIAETSETAETETAKEGYGKVNLRCGSQTFTAEGRCGGVVTMGEMIIAIQDKTVPQRVFTISFNTDQYPENGKTYTVKRSDYSSEGKKPIGDVYIGFSEVTQKDQMDWSSDNSSGTIQFKQSGNEIKCSFADIKLQPSEIYNKGERNNVGTVSGEMTFYKK